MSEEDDFVQSLFRATAGMGLGDLDLKDLEDILKSRLGMSNAGAVDGSMYEDVQTGVEEYELPARPLFEQYSSYAPTVGADGQSVVPLESRLAAAVDAGQSVEQIVAGYREDWRKENADKLQSNSRHGDSALQSDHEDEVTRIRKQAEDLWKERRDYNEAEAKLPSEAREFMAANPGARMFSKPIMEQSKAAQAFTDYGLPTPVDQWKNDDFFQGFGQRAVDTDAKREFLSQQQGLLRGARNAAAPQRAQRGPGAGQLMQDRNARDLVHGSGLDLDAATREFKDFHGEVTHDINIGNNQRHVSDQYRQMLAGAGRTPLSEAIRARLGR